MISRNDVGRVIGSAAVRLAERVDPLTSGPSAPLKTTALLDSFGPSLMPRANLHQGMAAGLAVLAGDAVGSAVDLLVRRLAPASSPPGWKLLVRAGIAAAGYAGARLPEREDEPTSRAALRSAADLTRWGALGGMLYESGVALRVVARRRYPARTPIRPVLVGAGSFAIALYRSRRLLAARGALIEQWTDEDKPASLGASLAIGWGVAVAGRALGRAYGASRRGAIEFFGAGPAHSIFARLVNAGVWAAGAAAVYTAGVSYVARSNETMEVAYATPPSSEFVSGGPRSISPFEDLGRQGRRYVTDVVTPDVIEATLGEPAAAHPVRVYIGFNSEPLYATGRAELALEDMERLGAFDRSHLLLFSPTGTGWVDHTMIESAEFLTRGDLATVAIQYGRTPSFLALQKVALGAAQFRQLVWGVKQRLAERPPEHRPRVFVFGESLGAWSSSDVVMHQGIAGFDHYGIERALWFGLPGLARWSSTGMREGSGDLVPPGTVRAFDRPEQLEVLSPEERRRLRAVVIDHDNDPMTLIAPRLAVKRPPWLRGDERGRNVPPGMQWSPVVTFVHVAVDTMNSMRIVPGQFKSFGHDYRADTLRAVLGAYHLPPVTPEQLAAVDEALVRREVVRGERIARSKQEARTEGELRTRGARWWPRRGDDAGPRRSLLPTDGGGEFQ